ncbi:hypothetical protein WUBG_18351, partial [Wuchereria bancrofti]
MHMRTHGMLQNCGRCSAVAFNEEQMKNHQGQHVPSTNRQQVVYVCSRCVATYSTVISEPDERLYHHMFSSHAQAILYFCKSCGLANTNGRVVYEHIIRNGCSWRVYGIPIETTLYICRLCCLAYESQVVYQMHMRTHGMLQNCGRCSAVAFNEEQNENHQGQHVPSTNRQQVVY